MLKGGLLWRSVFRGRSSHHGGPFSIKGTNKLVIRRAAGSPSLVPIRAAPQQASQCPKRSPARMPGLADEAGSGGLYKLEGRPAPIGSLGLACWRGGCGHHDKSHGSGHNYVRA